MNISEAHLTYCTNIHAGESWAGHFAAIRKYFPAIKAQVSPDQPMGIGLRLSSEASVDLIKVENLQAFATWLRDVNAYVFTMNGFPYGGFHHTAVKDQVHAPDWTTNERVEYTIRLFDILKELLPDGMEGGVSTAPLSYRYWFNDDLKQVRDLATENILHVSEHLISIRRETGKVLHLDIEPEPDGVLETGGEFIEWFRTVLLPAGLRRISNAFSVPLDEAGTLIRDHINLCYDVCHFAIGYEQHDLIISQLAENGIKIGKFQISAALKALMPADDRSDLFKVFSKYNEPTYLHQVVAKTKENGLLRYRDLPAALADIEHPGVLEWRAHFHVPVFAQYEGPVQSTQDDIRTLLQLQKKYCLTQHLEVETYTWEVLPDTLKLPIDQSIIRELLWVKNQIQQ